MANSKKIEIRRDFDADYSEYYVWIYEEYFQTKLNKYLFFNFVSFIQEHQEDERLISILESRDLEDLDIYIVPVPVAVAVSVKDDEKGEKKQESESNSIRCQFNKPILPPVQTGVVPARRGYKIEEFAKDTQRKTIPSPTRTPQGMTRVSFM
tara:strand:+ start:263 stop:718 length:456 start_codon:yes stop_codon:yes gene_type:complete